MKRIYQIIALLILVGCSGTNQEHLESNSTVTGVFNKSEIQDLAKILKFFDEQICATQQVDISKLSDCYQSFFERMEEAEKTGSIEIKIPFSEQQNLYRQINDSTFNEIWHFGKSSYRNSPDTLRSISLKYNSKYVNFLKELGTDDKIIKNYYDNFKASGGISPSMVASLLVNYDNYNINDIRVRLVIAIHYLTMNDQFERKEKY